MGKLIHAAITAGVILGVLYVASRTSYGATFGLARPPA